MIFEGFAPLLGGIRQVYTDKEKQVYDWIYSVGWLVFFAGAIILSGVLGK